MSVKHVWQLFLAPQRNPFFKFTVTMEWVDEGWYTPSLDDALVGTEDWPELTEIPPSTEQSALEQWDLNPPLVSTITQTQVSTQEDPNNLKSQFVAFLQMNKSNFCVEETTETIPEHKIAKLIEALQEPSDKSFVELVAVCIL